MGAGSGFKTFASGDILTASDVNGYLMQGVWVFANAAARTAAVTSPQEGNASFLKDTNALEIYDGAAWVAYGSGDITGVTTGANSGLTGGATSGTADIKLNMAAKGDLIAGTGSGTSTVVTVGANNTVLTADSTATGGIKWATPASTGLTWTLLNSGGTNLTGATTVTVSGISDKEYLLILVAGSSSANASSEIKVRINTDTGANYEGYGTAFRAPATYSSDYITSQNMLGQTGIVLGQMANNADSVVSGTVFITGGKNTTNKSFIAMGGSSNGSGSGAYSYFTSGIYFGSAAITSISVNSSTGNLDAGKVYVYAA